MLVLLAPFAVAVRWFARWRRGFEIRLQQHTERVEGDALCCDRFEIDVPQEIGAVWALTGAAVRLAEARADGNESYHLVRDEPGAGEPVVVSIGPSVQLFAERFMLMVQRTALENRTLLWLCLPSSVTLGEVLDPMSYSPEAEGEPDLMIRSAPVRWALALRWRRGLASVGYEVHLWVPAGCAEDHLRVFGDALRAISTA